jgi:hypothetical protein
MELEVQQVLRIQHLPLGRRRPENLPEVNCLFPSVNAECPYCPNEVLVIKESHRARISHSSMKTSNQRRNVQSLATAEIVGVSTNVLPLMESSFLCDIKSNPKMINKISTAIVAGHCNNVQR